jgi:dihydrofolate reductase
MNPRITIIVALSENNVIGDHLTIPWHIVADLKRFRAVTTGHTIIVGRTTFELIKQAYKNLNKPMPDRKTIIITNNSSYKTIEKECHVVHSMEEAIKLGKKIEPTEIFIAGGASIYKLGMLFADRLMLTVVHQTVTGDALFPDYSAFSKIISEESHEENGLHFTYRTLEP